MRPVLLLAVGGLLACDPYATMRGDTSRPRSMSAAEGAVYAPSAAGLAALEYAKQPDEDDTLGWDVAVEGEVVHWRACASATECTGTRVERKAAALLGLRTVGQAVPDGSDNPVDVVQIRMKHEKTVRQPP